jgi:hypothetical protein
VAEGGGLLNRYRVKSSIGGSNPPLSASSGFLRANSEPLRRKADSTVRIGIAEFAAVSLLLPWPIANRQCLCRFGEEKFFYGKNFPADFPAQGISRE